MLVIKKNHDILINREIFIVKLINLICCLYICVWTLIPLFRNSTGGYVFRIIFLVIAGIWFLTSLALSRKWFIEIFTISSIGLIYIVTYLFYYIFSYGDLSLNNFVTPFFVYLCIYMGYFYFNFEDKKMVKLILLWIAVCATVTFVTTFYQMQVNMDVSRLLTSSSTSLSIREYLEKKNIGSFDFIHGTLLLIPMILLNVKVFLVSREKFLPVLIVMASLAFAVIIMANFSIAYIILTIAIILSLLPSNKNIFLMFFLTLVIVLLMSPIIVEISIFILTYIKNTSPSIMTQIKMESLINVLNRNEDLSSTSVRFNLYLMSLKSFLSSPIYGIGGYYQNCGVNIGCHSQILDDLGRYGLFGAVPFLLFISLYFNKIKVKLKSIRIKNTMFYTILLFFLLAFVNPVFTYGISFAVFFVLPIYCKYLQERFQDKI